MSESTLLQQQEHYIICQVVRGPINYTKHVKYPLLVFHHVDMDTQPQSVIDGCYLVCTHKDYSRKLDHGFESQQNTRVNIFAHLPSTVFTPVFSR